MVNRVEQAADICRAVGLESAKVMADSFHMNIEEDEVAMALRDGGQLIGHVHVADSARLQPGTGHIDWQGAMKALRSIDYDGWLAMECGIRGEPRDALPQVAGLLRPLM